METTNGTDKKHSNGNGAAAAPAAPAPAGSDAELRARLEALENENKALRAARDAGVRFDVNKTGNVRMRVDGASYAIPPKHAALLLANAVLVRECIVKAERGER